MTGPCPRVHGLAWKRERMQDSQAIGSAQTRLGDTSLGLIRLLDLLQDGTALSFASVSRTTIKTPDEVV